MPRLAPRIALTMRFLLLFMALFIGWTERPVQAQSQPIACGGTVTGTITDDKWQDFWSFEGRAGQTVKISMWNTDDSGLYSRLILKNDGGYRLGRSRGIGDAYLEETLERAGTFTIEATRRDGTGRYSLSLTCVSPPEADEPTSGGDSSGASGAIVVDGNCSLSDAIIAANEDSAHGGCPAGNGADLIIITHAGTEDGTIVLANYLRVTSSITIEGGGFTVSGGNRVPVLTVHEGGNVVINRLTITEGYEHGEGDFNGRGGGIDVAGIATINDSMIIQNSAVRDGGGIHVREGGELNINDSYFENNSSFYGGGAIFNKGRARVTNSHFAGNSGSDGGAIYSGDRAGFSVNNSHFEGNSAYNSGGAINNRGDSNINNSHFEGNSAAYAGGAIWNSGEAIVFGSHFENNSAAQTRSGAVYNAGGMAIVSSSFANHSEEECVGIVCTSEADGGPQVDSSGDLNRSVALPDDSGDSGGSATTVSVSHDQLLAVEHVACTADDIYFILRLKSDTPVREHLFEVMVSTDGAAVLADILPMPTVKSLPERLASVVTLTLAAEGVSAGVLATTGVPLAGTVFKAGVELMEWIDEQFTRSSSPLHFRLTWYNSDVHPGIERYLVHATRSGDGSLRLATRLAPLSEAASWTRDVTNRDTFSTQIKEAIDVALLWMGKDPGGFGTGSELGDRVIDAIASPAEWALDKAVTGPVAYWAERFFTEAGVVAEPVQIC